MWRRAVKYSLGATAAGCAGGYVFLYQQHQNGMVPPGTKYGLNNKMSIPSRDQMIGRMRRENFDIVVIGGGATGNSGGPYLMLSLL